MSKNYIRVYCRLKPSYLDSPHERFLYEIVPNQTDNKDMLRIFTKIGGVFNEVPFLYNKIFDEDTNQEVIYNEVAKPVIKGVLEGYNGAIFAYGQTGSGKTYTISGEFYETSNSAIVHRSLEEIFDNFELNKINYTIEISFFEIYNETGRDLLNCENGEKKIIIQENVDGHIQLRNLSLHKVDTYKQFMDLYQMGELQRVESITEHNKYSSRSHCILTVYVTKHIESAKTFRRSKLNIIDLAGSERNYKLRSHLSWSTSETSHINLSLHYLEQVIVALGEKNRTHIPYRNSIMTTILRDSLGGNSITTVIATLSTSLYNIQESISTCRFAQRVALVKNDLKMNIEENGDLETLRTMLNQLKNQNIKDNIFLKITNNKGLTIDDVEDCKRFVKNFIRHKKTPCDVNFFLGNSDKIRVCFNIFKSQILGLQNKIRSAEKNGHSKFTKLLGTSTNNKLKNQRPQSAVENYSFTKHLTPIKYSHSSSSLENSKIYERSEFKSNYLVNKINDKSTKYNNRIFTEYVEQLKNLQANVEECKTLQRVGFDKLDGIEKMLFVKDNDNNVNFKISPTKIDYSIINKKSYLIHKETLVGNTNNEPDENQNIDNKDTGSIMNNLNKFMLSKSRMRSSEESIITTCHINSKYTQSLCNSCSSCDSEIRDITSINLNIKDVDDSNLLPNDKKTKYIRGNDLGNTNRMITSSEPVILDAVLKIKSKECLNSYDNTELYLNTSKTNHLELNHIDGCHKRITLSLQMVNKNSNQSSKKSNLKTNWLLDNPKKDKQIYNTYELTHYEGSRLSKADSKDMITRHTNDKFGEGKYEGSNVKSDTSFTKSDKDIHEVNDSRYFTKKVMTESNKSCRNKECCLFAPISETLCSKYQLKTSDTEYHKEHKTINNDTELKTGNIKESNSSDSLLSFPSDTCENSLCLTIESQDGKPLLNREFQNASLPYKIQNHSIYDEDEIYLDDVVEDCESVYELNDIVEESENNYNLDKESESNYNLDKEYESNYVVHNCEYNYYESKMLYETLCRKGVLTGDPEYDQTLVEKNRFLCK